MSRQGRPEVVMVKRPNRPLPSDDDLGTALRKVEEVARKMSLSYLDFGDTRYRMLGNTFKEDLEILSNYIRHTNKMLWVDEVDKYGGAV